MTQLVAAATAMIPGDAADGAEERLSVPRAAVVVSLLSMGLWSAVVGIAVLVL
ncbi:hypothetical protein [Marinimicrococcus flavescens]|uniref:Uncharacterized protein n=1 Tax=Marinimicrococcus flavescens TaxID=3031815 RepID=A0AAP3UZ02_9PROT|nr:hypothetical protein [Marinimicrococcus flavescens]